MIIIMYYYKQYCQIQQLTFLTNKGELTGKKEIQLGSSNLTRNQWNLNNLDNLTLTQAKIIQFKIELYNLFIKLMDDFFDSDSDDLIFEDDQGYDSIHTSYFNLKDENGFTNDLQFDSKKKEAKDTAQSQSQQIEQVCQKNEEQFKEGLYNYIERKSNQIQVNQMAINKYIQSKRGNKKQTAELTINFKTLLIGLLEDYKQQNKIQNENQHLIEDFRKSDSNLQSFRKLFGVDQKGPSQHKQNALFYINKKSDRIRKFCIDKMSQKYIGQKILKSKKMKFSNKITSIKFLEELRRGCVNPERLTKWKND